jgi:hypothetical protein
MSTLVSSANLPSRSTGRTGSSPRALLVASVVLIILIAMVRAWYCWSTDAWVNHPAGALIAMAADLKHGVFYRPLYGPEGYGGTRYFPLYFVLHALLMKLGVPILPGAFLLSAAAVVALLAGVFYLLRGLGVEPWLAACSTGVVLAAGCAQYSLVSPHADGLASALNVWGLAVVVRVNRSHRMVLLAAILFTLAWSAKITTVFGVAAAFVWLMGTGFPAMAWELAAETCCGYLLVGAALFVGSQGRFWEIFKACASGGTDLLGFASGPLNLLVLAARLDPGALLFLLLAAALLVYVIFSGKLLPNLPALLLIATLAVTGVIYGSPGINENHLLDVQVAAVILIATQLANVTSPHYKRVGICVLALAILVATLPLLSKFKNGDRRFHPQRFEKVVALVGGTRGAILSENPAIPLLAGQQAYVADPWMLRLLRQRIPGFGEPLLEGLRHQDFGAVVLCMADPKTDFGKWWYETAHFGPGFAAALSQNYRLVAIFDDQRVYLPIGDGSGQSEQKR